MIFAALQVECEQPFAKTRVSRTCCFHSDCRTFPSHTQNYRMVSLKETKLLLKSVLRRTMKKLTLVTGLSVPERFWFAAL